MYVALMQGPCDDEHHIVDHVAVGAIVQKLRQRFVRLQWHAQRRDTSTSSSKGRRMLPEALSTRCVTGRLAAGSNRMADGD